MANCGEVLIEMLEGYGIDTVFGIPGVHTIELYRGLADSAIRHITPRHEQGAGFMADGFFRASGRVAACLIITGPGMTNISTAMGQALADSIPMLVISSVNNSFQLGMGEGHLHEMPAQRGLVSQVARFSHTLLRVDELPKVLARAFTIFRSERPGPVHIEIPLDVLTAQCDHLDRQPFALPNAPAPSPHAVRQCVDLLKVSANPVIIVGGGGIDAGPDVIELAERLGAPVVNTVNAKGVMPYGHPLAVGGSGSCSAVRNLIGSADVVCAVGTEFGETDYDFFFSGDVQLDGKLIRIDIDASQLTRNVRADLAICSDATYALQAINLTMAGWHRDHSEGAARARATREIALASRDPGYARFFETIREALPEVIIVGDSTQPVYYAWLHYEAEKPRRYFHSASGFGTLGYAIPAAVGAKIAMPEQPVIGLIGDGAAQFTLGELASAVEAKLPVIFIIWNNSGYAEIKRFMVDAKVPPVGVDIYTPNMVDLGAAFGCRSLRAGDWNELKHALIQANSGEIPTLIEVMQQDFVDGYPAL